MKNDERTMEVEAVEVEEVTEKKKLSTKAKVAIGIGGGVIAGIILSALFGGKKHKDEEEVDTIELSDSDYEIHD